MKKIYTILVLLKNIIFRHRKYTLHFVTENDPPIKRWYYDFKHWGFDHAHLEMVSGADALCELYAKGKDEVTVNIIASRIPLEKYKNINYDEFIGESLPKNWKDKILYGRNYTNVKYGFDKDKNEETIITRMWICPVTLFVLGRYPKYIYIRQGLMI
jgi:hypothetical protein